MNVRRQPILRRKTQGLSDSYRPSFKTDVRARFLREHAERSANLARLSELVEAFGNRVSSVNTKYRSSGATRIKKQVQKTTTKVHRTPVKTRTKRTFFADRTKDKLRHRKPKYKIKQKRLRRVKKAFKARLRSYRLQWLARRNFPKKRPGQPGRIRSLQFVRKSA